MLLHRIWDPKLAQASYLIGCIEAKEALVIDPNRDVDQYLALAASLQLRVAHVTETHIHADFCSGARELAARAKAKLYLSDEGGDDWRYAFAASDGALLLHDGDRFTVGNISIQALHTPGHTPEHLSFLVTDGAAATEPIAAVTGDFVFVGDVGRPDLLERALHPDFEMVVPQRPARGFVGREQEVSNIRFLFETYPDFTTSVLRKARVGNEIWCETTASASGLEMAAVVVWEVDPATDTLRRGRFYSERVEHEAAAIDDFMESLGPGNSSD